MIPFCKDSGVGLAPYSPLAAGRVRDWDVDTARSKTDKLQNEIDSTEEQDKAIVARERSRRKYGVTRAPLHLLGYGKRN